MAKFTPEQAADVLAIKQVIYEWGDELDANNGATMTQRDCLTMDVRYNVAGEWRNGIEAVQAFYDSRVEGQRTSGTPMVMRHFITNLKIAFDSADHAVVDYLLLFFAKAGQAPFDGYCDPLATADVKMECRRGDDGEWRISLFDSGQIFRR